MKINKKDFEWLVEQNICDAKTAETVYEALMERGRSSNSLSISNVAYFLGGTIIMIAFGFFMVNSWKSFRGIEISIIIGLVIFFLGWTGHTLFNKPNLRVPGGILIACCVAISPLVIYGLQLELGWWPEINSMKTQHYDQHIRPSWVVLELSTIMIGLLVLRRYRFGFILFPVSLASFYLSMDLTPYLLNSEVSWQIKKYISMLVGSVMCIFAFCLDITGKRDLSFWLYLFGFITFWIALSLLLFLDKASEADRIIYAVLNVGFIFFSILVQRNVFTVLGGIGFFGYLAYLSSKIFADSIFFTFGIALIGIAIITLGVQYQKHRPKIVKIFQKIIPRELWILFPAINEDSIT